MTQSQNGQITSQGKKLTCGCIPKIGNTLTQENERLRFTQGELMTLILDQTSDTNHQDLHRILTSYGTPDFVKKASFEDILGPLDEKLPAQCYAHPGQGKFPCHTAAATWVSTGFLMDKKAEFNSRTFSHIWDNLSKAAQYHGIEGECKSLVEKIASDSAIPESKLADSDFALIFNAPDGSRERHLPVRNNKEVKAAANFLKKFKDKFPFEVRQKIAETLLDKANRYGTSLGELDDFLEKQAGRGACPSEHIADLIWSRVQILRGINKSAEAQVELAKLAKLALTNKEKVQHPEALQKIAGIIDEVDRTYGIKHSATVPAPEDVLFSVTAKAASKVRTEHVALTNGSIYKVEDFKKVALNDMRDVMGNDFADAISTGGLFVDPGKVAEIVPTLPRGDADLLDRVMHDNSINPFAKEAAHEPSGISKDDLTKLAAYHESRQLVPKVKQAAAKSEYVEEPSRGAAIASMVTALRRNK